MTSDRRQQILTEATSLFARLGAAGTSMRRIATSCGITEAAIYRHFENKADLYREAIRQKATRHDLAGQLEGLADAGDVQDVLGGVARAILALANKDPELMRLMFKNSFDGGEVAGVLFREVRLPFIAFLKEELRKRIDTGEIRPVDPFITARCFVGMVMDCALNVGVWTTVSEAEFQADDVVCNNVPIFARGLKRDAAG